MPQLGNTKEHEKARSKRRFGVRRGSRVKLALTDLLEKAEAKKVEIRVTGMGRLSDGGRKEPL